MMEPIDLEWLGASWHRIDALYAAQQQAANAGASLPCTVSPGAGRFAERGGGGARRPLWHAGVQHTEAPPGTARPWLPA